MQSDLTNSGAIRKHLPRLSRRFPAKSMKLTRNAGSSVLSRVIIAPTKKQSTSEESKSAETKARDTIIALGNQESRLSAVANSLSTRPSSGASTLQQPSNGLECEHTAAAASSVHRLSANAKTHSANRTRVLYVAVARLP
eukprot:SAG11_NODE_10978_length_792_cov_1.014430_2_plen_140_part_00